MKNPLRPTIDRAALKSGYINAYIPLGKNGLHIFVHPTEMSAFVNKREYDLAWLDFADHSNNIDAWMEHLDWAEAVMFKYGYKI